MVKPVDNILNKVFEIGKQHELESGDCAQSGIATVFEVLGIENDDVFLAATGLAGGTGLTGDGHCGALSGGAMAISYLYGRRKEDFHKRLKVLRACILSKKLHDWFVEEYGTCRCADISR